MMGRARGQDRWQKTAKASEQPKRQPLAAAYASSPISGLRRAKKPLRAQRISLTEPAGNTEKNLKRLKAEKSLSLTEATEITGNYNHISTDSAD